MKSIKTIVLDDEPKSRSYLVELLHKYCSEIEVCAQVSDLDEARTAIMSLEPELLFLDIELPGGNVFDLLGSMISVSCPVIFVTAYEEFAIKSFKYNAYDYLLKPVDPDDLVLATRKVVQKIMEARQHSTPKELPLPVSEADKLALPSVTGYDLVNMSDIIFIQAESNYSRFFLVNKKEVLVPKVLSRYEEFLDRRGFFRVHKSYLVNMRHVVRYLRGEGGMVEMSNGKQIDVSGRKKGEFLQLLHQIG